MTKTKKIDIQEFILNNIENHPSDISKITAQKFGISRQAVNKHLTQLSKEKLISAIGNTKSKIYMLNLLSTFEKTYQITSQLAEDVIWRNEIQPKLHINLSNLDDIWHYGFTEIFNNAIDHSTGTAIIIKIRQSSANTEMLIHDNGIGIFKKIQMALNLLDERHAVLELLKGKLTTDPKHHSGEGIFFTSRTFDSFCIVSGDVYFSHTFGDPEDWIFENTQFQSGTTVWMKINNHTERTLKTIFDQYTSDDDYDFNKTIVPVKMAQYGNDKLISRSQAKRLLARIELFKIVIFDFKDVEYIGQAFADEIFRVYANQHSDIQLTFIHANNEVKQMISRVLSSTPNTPSSP